MGDDIGCWDWGYVNWVNQESLVPAEEEQKQFWKLFDITVHMKKRPLPVKMAVFSDPFFYRLNLGHLKLLVYFDQINTVRAWT